MPFSSVELREAEILDCALLSRRGAGVLCLRTDMLLMVFVRPAWALQQVAERDHVGKVDRAHGEGELVTRSTVQCLPPGAALE